MTSTATARDQRRRRQQAEAAARARAQRVQRRRRLAVSGAIAVVLVAVGVMFGVSALNGSGSSSPVPAADKQGTAIANMLIATPHETISSIGLGTVKVLPTAVKDAPLTINGKPEILYLGADYCPFCAAERWPLVLALSRFGTFTNIGLTTSGVDDVFPGTHTFSFHDVGYRSDYISLVARELYDNVPISRGRYHPLDKATKAELALLAKYGNTFPLLDFGGRYVQSKASYSPGLLQGMSADDIAMTLATPQSPVAQAIAGTANVLTAAICSTTGGQPVAACTDPAVVAAAAKLAG